ncbi:MAG: glycosyltransferase family 2 protein [Simkaniaceae bacterium]|nr:glycosyltransferase family 2 protein [Simkaniaceae bacterium]
MNGLRIAFLFLVLVAQSAFSIEGDLADKFWKGHTISSAAKKKLLRNSIEPKKISLIIPCHYTHADQLHALLRMYENQTRLPDEVVISLSIPQMVESELKQNAFYGLEQENWAFPVTLLISDGRKYAGENRNIACSHASGDILICQDADDVPHPQRIEIIGYFFEKYKIDHLMHEFMFVYENTEKMIFPNYLNLDQIRFSNTKNFQAIYRYAYFTNGNPAITRELFQLMQWPNTPRGQDTEYNQRVYSERHRCIAIGAVLYGYRKYLSSSLTLDSVSENLSFEYSNGTDIRTPQVKKLHTLQVIYLPPDQKN